jgi:uncharacterized protein YdeI (YjbR/CyaY-like superfamily)
MKKHATQTPDIPMLPFANPQDWADWLEAQQDAPEGVWLKLSKTSSGVQSVTYAEALEIALCYGWIDGQKKAFDERFWLQKFTPRRAKSIWSKINCEKAEALILNGRMKPSGLREIERAKQDGRWDAAYDSQSKAAVPEDFQAALDQSPSAQAFFLTLNSVNRYAILFRIQTAKKAETRTKRIREFIAMLERNEKIHP